jgi:hypothetical protein
MKHFGKFNSLCKEFSEEFAMNSNKIFNELVRAKICTRKHEENEKKR